MLTAILHSRRREAIWCTPCGHDTAWEEEVRHDFGGGRIRSEYAAFTIRILNLRLRLIGTVAIFRMAQTIHDDPLVRDRSEHTPLYSPQRYLAAMRTRITLGARVCPPPNTKPTPSRERQVYGSNLVPASLAYLILWRRRHHSSCNRLGTASNAKELTAAIM